MPVGGPGGSARTGDRLGAHVGATACHYISGSIRKERVSGRTYEVRWPNVTTRKGSKMHKKMKKNESGSWIGLDWIK